MIAGERKKILPNMHRDVALAVKSAIKCFYLFDDCWHAAPVNR